MHNKFLVHSWHITKFHIRLYNTYTDNYTVNLTKLFISAEGIWLICPCPVNRGREQLVRHWAEWARWGRWRKHTRPPHWPGPCTSQVWAPRLLGSLANSTSQQLACTRSLTHAQLPRCSAWTARSFNHWTVF